MKTMWQQGMLMFAAVCSMVHIHARRFQDRPSMLTYDGPFDGGKYLHLSNSERREYEFMGDDSEQSMGNSVSEDNEHNYDDLVSYHNIEERDTTNDGRKLDLASDATQLVDNYRLSDCGIPYADPASEGNTAKKIAEKWPWLVEIQMNGTHQCEGAIIHERWVITAAHCVHGHNKNHLTIRSLQPPVDQTDSLDAVERHVHSKFSHPSFAGTVGKDDIALIRIHEPFDFPVLFEQPTCLPWAHDIGTNSSCYVAGHEGSDTLKQSKIAIKSSTDCASSPVSMNDNVFCAKHVEGGTDVCQNFTGGPLVCKNGDHYTLYGIGTWEQDCSTLTAASSTQLSVYTKLDSYYEWATWYTDYYSLMLGGTTQ